MAVTVSYGKCEKCGGNNVKSLSVCRHCGKALPWAKAPKVKPAKPAPRATSSVSSTRSNATDPTYWVMGLLIFSVSFSAPVLGYGIHRFLVSSENELAGFANTGMFGGVIIWALGFVSVMAKVGQMPTP